MANGCDNYLVLNLLQVSVALPKPYSKLTRKGNNWKNLESLIVSHVSNEADMFIPISVTNDAKWKEYLTLWYPGQSDIVKTIADHYSNIGRMRDKLKAFIGDSTFHCNTRWIAYGYPNKTYMLDYSRMGGQHGTDIIAMFIGTKTIISAAQNIDKTFPDFAKSYQSYLLSHARTGDPNTYRVMSGPSPTVPLERVKTLDHNLTVVEAGPKGFSTIQDKINSKEVCDFWRNIFAQETKSLGKSKLTFLSCVL
jgi:carboxylesterase type B